MFVIKTEDKEIIVHFNRTDNLFLRAEKYITKYNLSDSFGDTHTRNKIVDHMEKILEQDRKKNPGHQNDRPEKKMVPIPSYNPHSQPMSTSQPDNSMISNKKNEEEKKRTSLEMETTRRREERRT
jgi:hypothetical protein